MNSQDVNSAHTAVSIVKNKRECCKVCFADVAQELSYEHHPSLSPRRVQEGKSVCKKGRVCAIKSARHKGPESLTQHKGPENGGASHALPLIGGSAQELGRQSSSAKPVVPKQGLVWRVYRCVADVGGGVQGTAQGLFSVLTGLRQTPPTLTPRVSSNRGLTPLLCTNSSLLLQLLSCPRKLSACVVCCGLLVPCANAAYLNVCMCARNI